MNRLTVFQYWTIGVAVGCALISLAAFEQHRVNAMYKDHRAKYCSSLIATAQQKESCVEENTTAHDYMPWWYMLVSWPEGIETWAVIATGFFIAWQSYETRRSANATEDSVRLTQASNTQWVEFTPDGLFTKAEIGQPEPPTIVIVHPRWKVINNTQLPLTLRKVEIKIGIHEGWKSYVFHFEDELISPANNANYRSVFTPFALNTAETHDFLTDCIGLSIITRIDFIGITGKELSQLFGDLYICKMGSLEINHPIGKGPS